MFKKMVLGMVMFIGCVCCTAHAEINHYYPKETVGAADGECYALTQVQTVTNSYTKVGSNQRIDINLLSMTLHNPELVENYVCNYEGFTDNVYLPIIAGSAKNVPDKNGFFLHNSYVYNLPKYSFDFNFVLDKNKLTVRKGADKQFQGDVYVGEYFKGKYHDLEETKLMAVMLVKALDKKLISSCPKDAMYLNNPRGSFKVEHDFDTGISTVDVYNDNKYHCTYKLTHSYKDISLWNKDKMLWRYVAK